MGSRNKSYNLPSIKRNLEISFDNVDPSPIKLKKNKVIFSARGDFFSPEAVHTSKLFQFSAPGFATLE
jgi:hypothetical protein